MTTTSDPTRFADIDEVIREGRDLERADPLLATIGYFDALAFDAAFSAMPYGGIADLRRIAQRRRGEETMSERTDYSLEQVLRNVHRLRRVLERISVENEKVRVERDALRADRDAFRRLIGEHDYGLEWDRMMGRTLEHLEPASTSNEDYA